MKGCYLKNKAVVIWFIACLYILDQVSKRVVLGYFDSNSALEVVPGFFRLVLVYNKGAAWGMFQSYGLGLTFLAIGALIFLWFTRNQFLTAGKRSCYAFCLLVAGISGNLTDRLLYGHVIDFLSFYYRTFQWPAFNVADSSICIAVGLLLLDSFSSNSKKILMSKIENQSPSV